MTPAGQQWLNVMATTTKPQGKGALCLDDAWCCLGVGGTCKLFEDEAARQHKEVEWQKHHTYDAPHNDRVEHTKLIIEHSETYLGGDSFTILGICAKEMYGLARLNDGSRVDGSEEGRPYLYPPQTFTQIRKILLSWLIPDMMTVEEFRRLNTDHEIRTGEGN